MEKTESIVLGLGAEAIEKTRVYCFRFRDRSTVTEQSLLSGV